MTTPDKLEVLLTCAYPGPELVATVRKHELINVNQNRKTCFPKIIARVILKRIALARIEVVSPSLRATAFHGSVNIF